ncbi:hypothetical protein, partial [Salipiger aestuarii]|uniref:hypothetical protein n=1 Tax=Salipiger aestuarii TaxID=568098 RepID=UPI00197F7628
MPAAMPLEPKYRDDVLACGPDPGAGRAAIALANNQSQPEIQGHLPWSAEPFRHKQFCRKVRCDVTCPLP